MLDNIRLIILCIPVSLTIFGILFGTVAIIDLFEKNLTVVKVQIVSVEQEDYLVTVKYGNRKYAFSNKRYYRKAKDCINEEIDALLETKYYERGENYIPCPYGVNESDFVQKEILSLYP